MRSVVVICGALLLVVGCSSSSSGSSPEGPRFSGKHDLFWEVATPLVDPIASYGCPGFSDYSPSGKSNFYELSDVDLASFDPVDGHTILAGPADSFSCWPGAAWVGNSLYVMRNDKVYAYSIPGDEWTVPVTSSVGDTSDAQMTHDGSGNVYAVQATAPYRVVRYTPGQGVTTVLDTGGFNLSVNEPRIAWDPGTARLYIGTGYDSPELWAFDPAHPGTAVPLASVPSAAGGVGTGMGDPFCGDRSGHLYAIGDTGCSGSNTMFQYDIRTGTWTRLPDLPGDHGCDGACTVTDDGWLYVTPGDSSNLYRLRLY
jgi:hypothetical protein